MMLAPGAPFWLTPFALQLDLVHMPPLVPTPAGFPPIVPTPPLAPSAPEPTGTNEMP